MDGLLKKSGGEGLPLEECVRLGLLPDELSLANIARLSYQDNPDRCHALRWALLKAVIAGELKADIRLQPGEDAARCLTPVGVVLGGEYSDLWDCNVVHKEDLRRYLEAQELPLPDWWFPVATSEPERQAIQPPAESRRELQIQAILAAINALGFNPKLIPYRGKAKVKAECLKNTALFTASSFDHAWKSAKRQKLIQVENVEIYRQAKS